MLILKVHGTSGAGKTTAVRDFMEFGEVTPLGPDRRRPEAYRVDVPSLKHPVYILGPYENKCGGMDGVTSVAEQIRLIHHYAELGHVIYEGLLMSTYFGKIGMEMQRYGKQHIWAFLDTPIEVCIERIKQRRLAAGNTKPLNERNTRERLKPILSLKAKLIRMNSNVVDLKYDQDCGRQILDLLC